MQRKHKHTIERMAEGNQPFSADNTVQTITIVIVFFSYLVSQLTSLSGVS